MASIIVPAADSLPDGIKILVLSICDNDRVFGSLDSEDFLGNRHVSTSIYIVLYVVK